MAPQRPRLACSYCASPDLQFIEHFLGGPVYRCTKCGQGMVVNWEQVAGFSYQTPLADPPPQTAQAPADSLKDGGLLARLNARVSRRYQTR